MNRCAWAKSESMQKYHDEIWGVPEHDDKALFEFLILEGAQAGLSWETIWNRRAGYRKAFYDFDPNKVSKIKNIKPFLENTEIIRNKLKIASTIQNAKAFLDIQKEFKSFDNYIWSFTKGKSIQNNIKNLKQIPAQTKLSETISKDLKSRGFNFVGPTIIYAYMQAIGIVNDHEVTCFRYNKIK